MTTKLIRGKRAMLRVTLTRTNDGRPGWSLTVDGRGRQTYRATLRECECAFDRNDGARYRYCKGWHAGRVAAHVGEVLASYGVTARTRGRRAG